ncbi:hypothetical protein H0H81_011506 [Sphagnurus paluster]|uniref:F-box domain-containing protein n=1 Tax=Sphagnurus paluster TaxID=117069 RepID=A0A9P7FWT4_9AGAR|nr:hypothetical protein H0H81_011506 [Sphagnurus paluster]
MSSPNLPVEILDYILSFLYHDSKAWIECSKVCSAFLAQWRKLSFSTISLGPGACRCLYEALSSSPKTVSYIWELEVQGHDWAYDDDTFPLLLELLARHGVLRVFSFTMRVNTGIDWNDLPFNWQQALLDLLRSPHLHTVCLAHVCACTFPVEAFATAPALRNLSVTGTHSEKCEHPAPVFHTPKEPYVEATLSLDSLEVQGPSAERLFDFIDGPNSPFDLSTLKRLILNGSGLELATTIRDVFEISRSIEELWWFYLDQTEGLDWGWFNPEHTEGAGWDDPTGPVDLQTLPCLRMMTFLVDPRMYHPKSLYGFLEKRGLPPNIERLVVILHENSLNISSIRSFMPHNGKSLAEELDYHLSRCCVPERYPKLQAIEIWIFLKALEKKNKMSPCKLAIPLEHDIVALFPRLAGTKKMSVRAGAAENAMDFMTLVNAS